MLKISLLSNNGWRPVNLLASLCDSLLLQSSRQAVCVTGGWGVLPEKLGRGEQLASQNPYPIYDQNLQFSLPYNILWPDQKFDTLFMTWLLDH